MAWFTTPWSARNGLGFGLLAGAVFALAECTASLAGGQGVLEPVRYAASVGLGARGLEQAPAGQAVAVGLAVHLGLSAFLGLAYALLDARLSPELRASPSHQVAVGMLFAMGVWVVTFQFVARGYYPWFLQAPQFFQLLMHTLFFGAPLGLLFALAERRRMAVLAFEDRAQGGAPRRAGGQRRD